MNDADRHLEKVIALARDARPDAPAPLEDVRFFAQRTVSAWKRRRTPGAPPDPLRLWERVGNWSLAGAAAALVMIVLVQPAPPPPNPLNAFGPVETEELNLF